jgi:hypothetical protein
MQFVSDYMKAIDFIALVGIGPICAVLSKARIRNCLGQCLLSGAG